jgi:hypothetical protein
MALSTSPSTSSSMRAFLHSIIGAPLFSLKALIRLIETLAVLKSLLLGAVRLMAQVRDTKDRMVAEGGG